MIIIIVYLKPKGNFVMFAEFVTLEMFRPSFFGCCCQPLEIQKKSTCKKRWVNLAANNDTVGGRLFPYKTGAPSISLRALRLLWSERCKQRWREDAGTERKRVEEALQRSQYSLDIKHNDLFSLLRFSMPMGMLSFNKNIGQRRQSGRGRTKCNSACEKKRVNTVVSINPTSILFRKKNKTRKSNIWNGIGAYLFCFI